ncbi:MAG: hypothetical protein QNK29_09785 [Desulfobacterales bacterium]|nr:hypothetical protein [Desulfobacterales bacterium]MDX2512212.1 hypothetical protein [Desulfobacterales bacterium]
MKIHIAFTSIFLLLMLTMHVWYAYRDDGEWPWRSKKFWAAEARIGIIFVALVSAIFILGGRYKHNSWFWETRAFFACDWGMSPQDVFRVENLTGRPPGSVAPPQLKQFGELFHAIHAEKAHLYPLTHEKGRSPRSYFFYENSLISGCTYTYYRDLSDKAREKIIHERRKNTVAYGDPVYTKKGDMRVLIWDYDDGSYLGLIITADEQYGHVIKRNLFMDKNLGMDLIKVFTDHFLHSSGGTADERLTR